MTAALRYGTALGSTAHPFKNETPSRSCLFLEKIPGYNLGHKLRKSGHELRKSKVTLKK